MSDSDDSVETATSDKQEALPCSAGKRKGRVSTKPFELFKVGIRVPPFWPEEPELWFSQIEGQFLISNITADTTKFYYVTSHLEPQYSKEVKDIITSPPATNKYDKLKEELIKRLSASRERKIQQLLMHEELGNRKPSQFLRHLQSLAGTTVPDDFIRSIWCSRLPANLQTLIASQPTSTLEATADLADRVHDIVAPSLQVASTSSAYAVPGSMQSMANEIAELKAAVKNLTMQLNNGQNRSRDQRRPNRPNDRNRKRSRSRSQSNYQKFPNCWYHNRHGANATQCIKPCDYGKSGNAQGGR